MSNIQFIFQLIKPNWWLTVKAMTLAVLVSILEVVSTALVLPLIHVLGQEPASPSVQNPGFFESLLNFYTDFPAQWQLPIILLSLLSLTIFKNISVYLSSFMVNDLTLRSGVLLRKGCTERFLELELPFYSRISMGELLSYVNEQAHRCEQLFSCYLDIVKQIVTITLLLCFLIILSPILTIITVLTLAMVALSVWGILRGVHIHSRKSTLAIEKFSTLITEILSGFRVIKSFNAESRELERARQALDERYRIELTAYKFFAAVTPSTETVGIAALVVILFVGASLLSSVTGNTLPVLLTYTVTLLRLLPKVNHLNALRSQISLLSGSFERIQNFLLSPEVNSKLPDGSLCYRELQTKLVFENLTFTYPSNPEPTLLNINFCIPRGTTTAIVGSSGSGKSTLVDLVMRFYDPDYGRIQVDGIDIRELQFSSWRRAIAIVSQDTFLFNTSIRENIAYGRPHATESEIIKAADMAYAYEFIQDLPQGFDTVVGERGTRLSGGQRQRIAIARAILCDPDILILDEATSALDSKSEKIVQQAIESVSQGRTVIVIAHRLSTIEKADNIVVLQNGVLVEQGTHQELLALRGLYYSQYQAQTLSTSLVTR